MNDITQKGHEDSFAEDMIKDEKVADKVARLNENLDVCRIKLEELIVVSETAVRSIKIAIQEMYE